MYRESSRVVSGLEALALSQFRYVTHYGTLTHFRDADTEKGRQGVGGAGVCEWLCDHVYVLLFISLWGPEVPIMLETYIYPFLDIRFLPPHHRE